MALAGAAPAGVVITEIMYHPASDDARDEYVEILNVGAKPVDLTGWRLDGGVRFTMPEGAVLGPGAYLVIAADPTRARAAYGIPPDLVVGPWNGSLANDGELVQFVDAAGEAGSEAVYDDGPPWPVEADGGGPSLEVIDPLRPIATARNWLPSAAGWFTVEYTGSATSSTLYIYLLGPGSCLLDDLAVTPLEGGAPNHVPNGSFAGTMSPWQARGNHDDSAYEPDEGDAAPGCLRLVATAAGEGSTNGLVCSLDPPLVQGSSYRMTFRAKLLAGTAKLVTRLSGGGLRRDTDPGLSFSYGTPGRPNSVAATELAPLVAAVAVTPPVPRADERPRVTARVEADGPAAVVLQYYFRGTTDVPLYDNGIAPDEEAGDGQYTALLPSFPAGELVRFEVTAVAGALVSRPFASALGIASEDAASNLPVYWIFVAPDDWNQLNANIWSEASVPALLVAGGQSYPHAELRFRGGRPRLFRKKSLKLEFRHERFAGRRDLNLNAAAMDDDYMTEPLAYVFYGRVGVPASRTQFVRVQLNGEFWGLFIDVEQVDEDYLTFRQMDPNGALYKAVGISSNLSVLEGTTYTYETQYEKKTRLAEPYDDLISFIRDLATAPDPETFLNDTIDVEALARYLAVTNLICVWDAIQHNYYFYRPAGPLPRWRVIPWDLDHAWGEWEWVYYSGDTFPLLMGHADHRFAGAWYTWNNLWTVFFDVPSFRKRYHDLLRELVNTEFTEWRLFPSIERFRAEIEPTVLLDEAKWPDAAEPQHTGPRRTMAQELPLLRQTISSRRRYVALQLGVTLREAPGPLFRRGDANADGQVNLGDAVTQLAFLFGSGAAPSCRSAADANDDAGITIADPVRLLAYLFGGEAAPPPPFAACDEDPTEDKLGCEEFAPCAN
jgi:spore coat protein H